MTRDRRPGPPVTGGGRECPGDEQLAQYADGVLAGDEGAAVERHLIDCADCRAVLVETMAFAHADTAAASASAKTGRIVPFPSRRAVIGVVAALAVAAALVLAARVTRPEWLFGPRSDRPELQELIAAVAKEPTRLVEGRLTGGFKYARPPSPTRGPGEREVSPEVNIAWAHLAKAAETRDTPENEAALGVAYLALGQLDQAISTLEHAAARQSGNALLQSDLSAAYCARARRLGRRDDFERALRAADQALKTSPLLTEALFNRALALEHLGDGRNVEAWNVALRSEQSVVWQQEARGHLK